MRLKYFKNKFLLILLFSYVLDTYTQEKIDSSNSDSILIKTIDIKKEVNKEFYARNYYSIQLYSGNYKVAKNIMNDFKKKFPNCETSLIFETPNYKIRVGNFKKIIKAYIELEHLKKIYKSAFILQPKNL
ncbi:MAG: hypothetical protein P8M03_06500 [Flavobacteriaceae bacterium]|nr:hypothetical protein [Flavobacteriaceae bacterium]